MKEKIKFLFISFLVVGIFLPSFVFADVYVESYVRKDGTYVQSHYRSDPDGNVWNNWSTKGNINPYTGKPGTKNPYSSTPSWSVPTYTPSNYNSINCDDACKNNYGSYSYYTSMTGNKCGCACREGYQWNEETTACIKSINDEINIDKQDNTTERKSYLETLGPLVQGLAKYGEAQQRLREENIKKEIFSCPDGYVLSSDNKCITHTENCRNYYGENVYGIKGDNNSSCRCLDGYVWNEDRTSCVAKKIIYDKACQDYHGSHSYWNGEFSETGNLLCACEEEYMLSNDLCIKKKISFLTEDTSNNVQEYNKSKSSETNKTQNGFIKPIKSFLDDLFGKLVGLFYNN